MKQSPNDRFIVTTEMGVVQIKLAWGSVNERRELLVEGPELAVKYVKQLLNTSYGDNGRLIGNACTSSELAFILSQDPLKAILLK
jgi:hypothetical protein